MSEIQPTKTQDDFIADVQKWALLDSQLKIVNEKTRKMRELKHRLTTQICNYIDTHQLNTNFATDPRCSSSAKYPSATDSLRSSSAPCNISLSDGELRIYEKREYSPLTYGYIETCLKTIIKNPDHIEYIIKYLKDHREIKITRDIKRI